MTDEELTSILVIAHGMHQVVKLVPNDSMNSISINYNRRTDPDWEGDNTNLSVVEQNFAAVILECALSFNHIAVRMQKFRCTNRCKEKSFQVIESETNYTLFVKEQFTKYFSWMKMPGIEELAIKYFLTMMVSLCLTKKFNQAYFALLKKIECYKSHKDLPEYLQLEIEHIKLGGIKSAIESKQMYNRIIGKAKYHK
ncbi:MAG: hypothetical protein WBM13_10615 [Bacteroidia bacterium]